jgi:hypothetical protein
MTERRPRPPGLMSTQEVAKFLGVSPATVGYWVRTGRIEVVERASGKRPTLFDTGTVERYRDRPRTRKLRDVDLASADEQFRLRFWSKVDRDGPIPPHRPELGPCWIWTAGKHRHGYGLFTFGEGNYYLAHIASYALAKSPIRGGLQVCHHCDNPPCCNPAHLFLGTARDNARDMHAKGREGPRNPGTGRANARLTDDLVRAIRATPPYHGRTRDLARQHGVSETTIRKILNGQKWRHVA